MSSPFSPTFGASQLEFFRQQGYLFTHAITTQDEVAWMRDVYDEVLRDERALKLQYENGVGIDAQGSITQIFLPERQCPRLLETQYITNARRLAADLLGIDLEECRYGGLMLIYKPAAAGRDTPWHQDEIYWEFPTQKCHSLSVWMPLDEVTVDSGCMQFLPGSHQLDVLRYRRPPGEPLVLDEPVDLSSAVACPLAPGGATFHHCRTLHHTARNTSARPRRALTCIFHGPRTARATPIEPPRVAAA